MPCLREYMNTLETAINCINNNSLTYQCSSHYRTSYRFEGLVMFYIPLYSLLMSCINHVCKRRSLMMKQQSCIDYCK